jgi:high-affinity nickel permease
VFGLDEWIAHLSSGAALLTVAGVAILLGLRHASDPDHLAAVATLLASGRERTARLGAAARLGLSWGAGHAASLFAFGLPIVLFEAYLPAAVQKGAETTVGILIVGLAVWLLVRWRRGVLQVHRHVHNLRARSPLQAFGVGLLHGMGGSAGVGVLLLAAIDNRGVAVVALALFAVCTALSMAGLSTGVGLTLAYATAHRSFGRVVPALGGASLLFGVWYALGALQVAPYFL